MEQDMKGNEAPGGNDPSLGSYLRRLRAVRGLTLRQVAARSGVSNPYLCQLELDRVKHPAPRFLRALADCYGVEYLELMRLAGHPVEPAPDGAGRPPVTFVGAERLTPEEQDEVQGLITWLLRRRERAQQADGAERLRTPA